MWSQRDHLQNAQIRSYGMMVIIVTLMAIILKNS